MEAKISVNKLWKASGKEVSFKEFVTDYNKRAMKNFDGGCQDAVVEEGGFDEPAPQPVFLQKHIVVSQVVRRGIDTKALLFYGGVGLAAGVLVGLLIKKL